MSIHTSILESASPPSQNRFAVLIDIFVGNVVLFVDLMSILVMLIGFFHAVTSFVRLDIKHTTRPKKKFLAKSRDIRALLASYILLGLELMIIADIARMTITHEFMGLIELSIIVVIRILIEWSLNREMKESQAEEKRK